MENLEKKVVITRNFAMTMDIHYSWEKNFGIG